MQLGSPTPTQPCRERRRGGNGLPGTGSGRRRITVVESFNYAVEGIIHVLRTHRNMRIHFAAAAAVLIVALWVGVDRMELVVLLLAIAFVLIAEMINSAIEAAIDVATSSFDPLAKLAKDIAAGAVLIASINAIAVGYLVFSGHVSESSTNFLDRLRDAPIKVTIIALILVVFVVITTKALTGRGTPLRGGLPFRARGDRVRGVDGGDTHARAQRAPVLRFDDHVRRGRARRPHQDRGRDPLDARGRLRRRARRRHHPRRLPALLLMIGHSN